MPAPAKRSESGAHFLLSRPALTEPQASVMGTNYLSFTSVAPKALTEAEGERHGVQSISEPEIYHGAGY